MNTPHKTASTRYTNIALSVIAVMLTLLVAERFSSSPLLSGPVAQAAPSDEPIAGVLNAAEQRKQIIAELRSLNARMDKLTASIKSPMPVKVTELPAGFAAPRDQK